MENSESRAAAVSHRRCFAGSESASGSPTRQLSRDLSMATLLGVSKVLYPAVFHQEDTSSSAKEPAARFRQSQQLKVWRLGSRIGKSTAHSSGGCLSGVHPKPYGRIIVLALRWHEANHSSQHATQFATLSQAAKQTVAANRCIPL